MCRLTHSTVSCRHILTDAGLQLKKSVNEWQVPLNQEWVVVALSRYAVLLGNMQQFTEALPLIQTAIDTVLRKHSQLQTPRSTELLRSLYQEQLLILDKALSQPLQLKKPEMIQKLLDQLGTLHKVLADSRNNNEGAAALCKAFLAKHIIMLQRENVEAISIAKQYLSAALTWHDTLKNEGGAGLPLQGLSALALASAQTGA